MPRLPNMVPFRDSKPCPTGLLDTLGVPNIRFFSQQTPIGDNPRSTLLKESG